MLEITLTMTTPLSDEDRAILQALAGAEKSAPITVAAPAEAPAKPKAASKPKPPKKEEAPAPKEETPAPKEETPEPKEETPEPEPVEESPSEGPTLQDAVARAAELLQAGEADRVKAALKTLDVARVSQLKPAQVPDFLEDLS